MLNSKENNTEIKEEEMPKKKKKQKISVIFN